MKIVLIQTFKSDEKPHLKNLFSRLNMYPSLALEQLAGNTSNEHDIKLIIERNKKINFNVDADVVGISCFTPQAPRAYEIADEFRRIGIKVVLGGWHPSALPEEAKQHADSVVIGEAEETWPRLLNDLKKNELKPFYENNKPLDLTNIKWANRKINKKIDFLGGVQASRGCPMGCEFCGVSNQKYGKIYRERPISEVIEEIKTIKQKRLWFYDPSLTINPVFTKKLFKEMNELNKTFYCFGNMNILSRDEELLKLASEAGCKYWFVGFESASQKTINLLGKKSNKVDEYKSSIKKVHDYNMNIIGAFIFGFDSDTKNVFKNTLDMVYKLEIDSPEFNVLTPYPGTPLFDRLDKEERILTKDWSKYTEKGNVVFKPKNMTPEELLEGSNWALRKINSFPGYIRNLFNSKSVSF